MSRPKRFGRDSNLVSDGTIVFMLSLLKKMVHFGNMIYKERSSIPYIC